MILYKKTYEREGNDAWLKDFVQLHNNEMGLYLEHKQRWSGWNGDSDGDYTLKLDRNDLEASQIKLDAYIEENSLFDKFPNGDEEGIVINLKNIFDERDTNDY